MSHPFCRWGILGAANIARKNWQAIRDAGNATLVAVASREVRRAQAFVDECQAQAPHPVKPEALGNYEQVLARPDIDAVYIPLPTGLRKQWVIRAAEAGKHVLVEKPAGIDAAEVAEMIAACERHRVQFMDGVMFMHGRRFQKLRAVLDTEVGSLRHIASQFSFLSDEEFSRTNIRAHGALEPLGCLGDLGWYCLRFTLWAMGEIAPLRVTGRIHAETQQSAAPPVPLAFSGTLEFAGGVGASYHCSFNAMNAGTLYRQMVVEGTNVVRVTQDPAVVLSLPVAQRISAGIPSYSTLLYPPPPASGVSTPLVPTLLAQPTLAAEFFSDSAVSRYLAPVAAAAALRGDVLLMGIDLGVNDDTDDLLSDTSYGLSPQMEQSFILGTSAEQPLISGLNSFSQDDFEFWVDPLSV